MSSGVGVLEEEEGAEEAAEEVDVDTSCVNGTERGSGSSMGRRYQDVSRSITEDEAAASKEEDVEDDREKVRPGVGESSMYAHAAAIGMGQRGVKKATTR